MSPASTTSATAINGMIATGPPTNHTTPMNTKMNGKSTSVATVAEVMNSRSVSNSRTLLAKAPADSGRAVRRMPRIWSKIRLANTTSVRRPATSM